MGHSSMDLYSNNVGADFVHIVSGMAASPDEGGPSYLDLVKQSQ
jgi:hypothetical protein